MDSQFKIPGWSSQEMSLLRKGMAVDPDRTKMAGKAEALFCGRPGHDPVRKEISTPPK